MHILDSNNERPPRNDERRLSAQAKLWHLATQCGCEWHVEISSLYLSILLLKRNCYVAHKATRNKNCPTLFVVLSYCNLVSLDSRRVWCEKWKAEKNVMWLRYSVQPCPVEQHGRRSKGKTEAREAKKDYLHYSFKDNDYPELYDRFTSYRRCKHAVGYKNQSLSAVGG